jgi:iron complex transport system substrate-binding protein
VEELIEIAGGEPVFPELRDGRSGKERLVDPAAVVERDPEVVIASWCGRKVNKDAIRARPGWGAISAVRNNHVYEIKSTYILQPGPASLTEGVRQLHAILAHAVGVALPQELAPAERMDPDLA